MFGYSIARHVGIAFMLVVFMAGAFSLAGAEPSTALTVSQGKDVSLEYTLRGEDKVILDTNIAERPLVYTHGGKQIVPGLEKELEGMAVGEQKQVVVQPEEGYGLVNPQALLEVDKTKIPADALKVGAMLDAQDGNGHTMHPRVKEIKEQTVLLDFNHPLAGKTLYFDVRVVDIQEGKGPAAE